MKNNNILILLVALVIAFVAMTGLNKDTVAREVISRDAGDLEYDGQKDYFGVTILDYGRLVEGNDAWIKAKVINPSHRPDGEMYVQCSILDKQVHTWLEDSMRQADIDMLGVRDNCVANERFTETARVELDSGESYTLRFEVEVPEDNVRPVIYCEAFERCAYERGDAQDSFTSSRRYVDVEIREGDECDRDGDCDSDEVCIDDACVDECDENEDCSSTELCRYGGCLEECDRDSDCADDYDCEDSVCRLIRGDGDEGDRCDRDSDCDTDLTCHNEVCKLECNDDDDCPSGDVCSDDACIDEDDACDSDSDCRSDEECVRGECIDEDDYDECDNDGDCIRGEECVRGRCRDENEVDEYTCTVSMACPGWFTALFTEEVVECDDGWCEYSHERKDSDVPPSLTDDDLEDWAEEHQALLWGLVIVFIFVWFIMAYSEPKNSRPAWLK